jgi:glycerol-3-phosphate dehydrogenase (NAD(P)+)
MSMIAEGYYATKNAYELISDSSQQFKIINSAYKILYENKSPRKIIKDLTIDLD